MTDWLFPALCGLLTGILSSWGVGGGTLLLLCMTLFFGVEQRTAQAINLLYFLPTAGISLFAHRKNGYLDKAVLCAAIPTGTLCALAAAFLTTMVDSSVFRKPFGLFLLYAGLSILFEKKKNSKKENAVTFVMAFSILFRCAAPFPARYRACRGRGSRREDW